MKKVISSPSGSSPASDAAVDIDHSREIMDFLGKEPGDQMTCVCVYDDFYRCNWWAPGIPTGRSESLFPGLEVSTYRVRKSRFVRAAMRDGQLVVEDRTPQPASSED